MSEEKKEMTTEDLLSMARERGVTVTEQTSYFKLQGKGQGKAAYVAKTKRGITRINVAGFEVSHPAVTPLSASDAKALRLGTVRGQIEAHDGELPDGWLDAYGEILDQLNDPKEGIMARTRGSVAEEDKAD